LNKTHDPLRRSWVESANAPDTDFPIQNLPLGVFKTTGRPRGGVALGDRIIDLKTLLATGLLTGAAAEAARAAGGETLLPLLQQPPEVVSALRHCLSDLFRKDGDMPRPELEGTLVPMAHAELLLPVKPTAFTDFCASIDHIRRMGAATGLPPKLAWMALPVAYNGRASSVAVSGKPVVRPRGLYESPSRRGDILFGPEPMLDFELEFGVWLRGGNRLGQAVAMSEAESCLFGCCLVNDWSARGIQFFESMLGPHLGKSFMTTASPWIVTMEALAPFRAPARGREADEPQIPEHLLDADDRAQGAIGVELVAELTNASGASAQIVRTNPRQLFWTLAQMVTHQASGGAPLEAGDLVATGTVSGSAKDARACMVEINAGEAAPVRLPDGSTRTFLEDGDRLTIRGRAVADGYVPIGFGDCVGIIFPAAPTKGERATRD